MLPALLLVVIAAPTMAANTVRLKLDRLVHPQVEAQDLALEFVPAAGDQSPQLRLTIERLRLAPLDTTLRDVAFQCDPQPVPVPAVESAPAAVDAETPSSSAQVDDDAAPVPITWQCDGPLQWRGGQGWRLSWQADEALTQARLNLSQGRSELAVELPLSGSPLALQARRVGRAWLDSLAPQLDWQGGQIDASMTLATEADQSRWRGRIQTRDLAAQTADGAVAMAGIGLSGPLDVRIAGGGLAIDASPTITTGEVLAGPVYVGWPADSAVRVNLALAGQSGRWTLNQLRLADDDLQISAQGRFEPGSTPWLKALAGDYRLDLAHGYGRYLDGMMAGLGQRGLRASGQIHGAFELADGGRVQSLDARLAQVDLHHPDGRYSLTGLDGDLAFREDAADAARFELAWQRLGLHGLSIDPGRMQGRTSGGAIHGEPVRLGLFGGSLVAHDLVFRPLSDSGATLETSLTAEAIDMAGLVRAFGWPEFGGQVSGHLPRLRYGNRQLSSDGEIDIRAFDGQIRVSGLAVERPFGVAPALSADVALTGLDMQPMTEVFGFGRIEGRLNGRVERLRLLDWRPVAFDAEFRTVDSGRRRISQLAVEQLTQIGGGGGAGGIQGRLLGAFDSFSYRRIGLSCRLANEVCLMSGLDEAAGGFTIMQGSGIPLITIRGFQNRVDWPVLLDRLQAAITGDGPTVE